MKKFRLYWDTEKETAWLNQMANDGWNVTGFSMGFYTFEKCEPGEYQYQIDTSDGLWKCSKKYRDFMESMGIEIVCCWGVWVVLRRKSSEGEFQLYSDDESRLEHLKKILNLYKIIALIEIGCMMVNVYPAIFHNSRGNLICAAIISIFVFLFAYLVYITKNRINRILQNKGEENKTSPKNPMLFCSIGWLFMLSSYAINRTDSMTMDIISIVLALMACIFFGLSLRVSVSNKKK
ncbi:MAG: DUF2812 domain-containing protein [Treponema sp.]|nr:DUF2812 domain-containing protein [Treponema sp.]